MTALEEYYIEVINYLTTGIVVLEEYDIADIDRVLEVIDQLTTELQDVRAGKGDV